MALTVRTDATMTTVIVPLLGRVCWRRQSQDKGRGTCRSRISIRPDLPQMVPSSWLAGRERPGVIEEVAQAIRGPERMGSPSQRCGALEVRRRVIDEKALSRLDSEAGARSQEHLALGLGMPNLCAVDHLVELAVQAQCGEVVVQASGGVGDQSGWDHQSHRADEVEHISVDLPH